MVQKRSLDWDIVFVVKNMDYSYYSDFDSNAEGSAEAQPQYTNLYSLWGSSQYYNTNELSPRNYFRSSEETEQETASAVVPKQEADRDIYNRRTVKRDNLFERPDFQRGTK